MTQLGLGIIALYPKGSPSFADAFTAAGFGDALSFPVTNVVVAMMREGGAVGLSAIRQVPPQSGTLEVVRLGLCLLNDVSGPTSEEEDVQLF